MPPRIWTALGLALLVAAGCSDPVRVTTIDTNSPTEAAGESPGQVKPPEATIPDAVTEADDDAVVDLSPEALAKKSTFELMKLANEALDPEEQRKLLDAALAQEPKHLEALTKAMAVTQQQGQAVMQTDRVACMPMFAASAAYAKRLLEADPKVDANLKRSLALSFYNGACSSAIGGKGDEAMEYLVLAVDNGFRDPIIEQDSDLDSLRGREDFPKLMERLQETMAGKLSFPFDFKLTDLEGKTLSLSDFKGKVTIVDFWGTWCPPCRQEIPHFVELQDQYRDQGLAIVGLNYEQVGEDEAKPLIQKFARENNMNYPCAIVDEDTMRQVPDLEGFPTTLFVDRAGKVRRKLVGYHAKEDLEKIVNELLAEAAPTSE